MMLGLRIILRASSATRRVNFPVPVSFSPLDVADSANAGIRARTASRASRVARASIGIGLKPYEVNMSKSDTMEVGV